MTDTQIQLNCPACGEKMTKIYVPEQQVNIDICLDGCGGILFDNRELEKFDDENENIDEILQVIKNKTFNNVDNSATRVCPICNTQMAKMGAAQGEIEIDVCYICGAKFLDNNELQVIRNSDKTEYDKHIDYLIQQLYEQNLQSILGKYADKDLKKPKLYQFFQKLVDSYMLK